jgi:hypothetical protein
MTDFLLISLIILFTIQLLTFFKIVTIIQQINKLLLEVKLLLGNGGIFLQPKKNTIIQSNSCQYCKYRISYIQITNEENKDNFYYKCKNHDIEISLSDSCAQFQRDYSQV